MFLECAQSNYYYVNLQCAEFDRPAGVTTDVFSDSLRLAKQWPMLHVAADVTAKRKTRKPSKADKPAR